MNYSTIDILQTIVLIFLVVILLIKAAQDLRDYMSKATEEVETNKGPKVESKLYEIDLGQMQRETIKELQKENKYLNNLVNSLEEWKGYPAPFPTPEIMEDLYNRNKQLFASNKKLLKQRDDLSRDLDAVKDDYDALQELYNKLKKKEPKR